MRSQPVSLVPPVGLFVVWLGSITDNQIDQIDPKTKQTSVLTRIIHDGSSRNRAVAKRDRRAEPRGREASLNRMLTD
jgi:hypothetical protein